MSETRKLKKGDTLIREGEESNSLFYLQSGTLDVYKMKGLKEHLIGHIYSGELVGEMSFLDSLPRSATVKANSESEVIEIPHEKYAKFFNGQPAWYKALIKTLTARLRRANAYLKV